jgi:nucleoside-diphosphate-sugar epimerase
MNLSEKRIYVAGSNGMVGSAVVRKLLCKGCQPIARGSAELNLIDQRAVENFFAAEKPEVVVLAAAKVGGILANDRFRADFIYDNLMIEANVIHSAFGAGVEKLIFLGSSCIYPRLAAQPMREEELLTGPLESTNEPYAIAKIAGIKLCESYFRQHGANFFSAMPTNLYGPNDNFDPASSHVIPALINKIHAAKLSGQSEVTVWGTGTPRREFMYVDDVADAVVFLAENVYAATIYESGISHVNIGCGKDIEIKRLAELIAEIVGFGGSLCFDPAMPSGTPRKLLDVSRLTGMGWTYVTTLEDGLRKTYEWYLESQLRKKTADR